MEFYRWILIATGLVLLVVAFLMGRKKTSNTVRRTNVVKPVVKDSGTPTDSVREPVRDPLHAPLHRGSADSTAYQHSDDGMADNRIAYGEEQFDHDYAVSDSAYSRDSLPTGTVASDDFEDIDFALDNEPYEEGITQGQSIGGEDSVKVISFASAVQAANEQDELVASDIEELDNNFYEEFDSYSEPVQLEEFEEKLVSIHVVALSGRRFYGKDLKALFDKHGYVHGRMSLYHCSLDGNKVFSVANMVKPGTFDEDKMRIFETPGITLFMRLPIDLDSDVAFDFLIQEAKELAQELDGQLRDGNRNPLSEQTIQHMREDMQQYVFRNKQILQPAT